MTLTTHGYLEQKYLTTPYLASTAELGTGAQVNLQVQSGLKTVHAQVGETIVAALGARHAQVARTVVAYPGPTHAQVQRAIASTKATRAQVQQVVGIVKAYRAQVARHIIVNRDVHMQIAAISLGTTHAQVTLSLYNALFLRVLDQFPTRGTDGVTWTASSTAPGDFGANNLNNDIVEYYWRSVDGVTSAVTLDNDSQLTQGFFNDTIGLLGHNLTLSANVLLQESNASDFGVIGNEVTLPVQKTNLIWLAPMLPTSGFRYRRLRIDDPTNPDNYLRIGTIVMGAARIFVNEDVTDQIGWKKRHFKDVIQTEGFTNVSNDRALKRALHLSFRDMDFSRNNYAQLQAVFDYARTSLKCLWIPTPEYPTRFAIFGKIVELPDETHNDKGQDIDFISLDLDIDESL